MVSVLAFYSDDLNSNPTQSSVFILYSCLKRTKKRPGMAHIKILFKLKKLKLITYIF